MLEVLDQVPEQQVQRFQEELLLAELESALAGPDGRLQLSFEIVYGHAFRPLPRVRVAAETRLSVEALRSLARAGGKSASDA